MEILAIIILALSTIGSLAVVCRLMAALEMLERERERLEALCEQKSAQLDKAMRAYDQIAQQWAMDRGGPPLYPEWDRR